MTDYLFQNTLYLISALCCTLLLLSLHLGSFSSRGCLSAPAILWWWGGSRLHQGTWLETEPSIASISLTTFNNNNNNIYSLTLKTSYRESLYTSQVT